MRRGRAIRQAMAAAVLATALALASGCGKDFARMRSEHAHTYGEELAQRTAAALPEDRCVGLDDCVRIAMANNLDLKTAEIERRLAALDRKIAFANFLPQVDVDWSYQETRRPVKRGILGNYVQTADRGISEVGVSAQQAIFMPQTWFLYAAYQKGEQVSEYVKQRTQQAITLQVVSLYYAWLSQHEAEAYLGQSVREGQALLDEVRALEREGVATTAERQAAEALVLSRQKALDDNARAKDETKAQLLETMGLSPLADVTLRAETPLTAEAGTLEDLVLEAMLQRPELHVADRMIEIRKDEVKIAIADFLPVLNGFTSLTRSSDSFLQYASTTAYGVSSVLTVFDGFANIYRYREARERQTEAFVDRERQCLAIMVEVVVARHQVEEAAAALAVARKQREAVESHLGEVEAQWREGLIETSQRLSALADRDGAAAQEAVARYQEQVAAATLADVLGRTKESSQP